MMRVMEATVLDVVMGWVCKSSIITVCVEEWKESKLEKSSRESSKSRPKLFRTFDLLKYAQ